MKKKIIVLLILCISGGMSKVMANQPPVSVEKSIWGIQAAGLGLWAFNESKLFKKVSLRSEIGYTYRWRGQGGWYFGQSDLLLLNQFSLEPRLYYNLEDQHKKMENTNGNSANFFAIKMIYSPGAWSRSYDEYARTFDEYSVIVSWGMRKVFPSNAFIEVKIGAGEIINNPRKYKYPIAFENRIRIGYNF